MTAYSVPLCYVYPAMLHYKACARTRRQKAADIALMVFGMIAAAYTSAMTIKVRRRSQIVRFGFVYPCCEFLAHARA